MLSVRFITKYEPPKNALARLIDLAMADAEIAKKYKEFMENNDEEGLKNLLDYSELLWHSAFDNP